MSASWPLSTSLPLGALPGATPCARLHARAVLAEWGLEDLAEAAELIVSELVTNAVRASTGRDGKPRYDGPQMPVVVLRMASDRIRLVIEVWDGIPGAPAAAHPGPDDESGRGLVLVAAQCDRWSGRRPRLARQGRLGRVAQPVTARSAGFHPGGVSSSRRRRTTVSRCT